MRNPPDELYHLDSTLFPLSRLCNSVCYIASYWNTHHNLAKASQSPRLTEKLLLSNIWTYFSKMFFRKRLNSKVSKSIANIHSNTSELILFSFLFVWFSTILITFTDVSQDQRLLNMDKKPRWLRFFFPSHASFAFSMFHYISLTHTTLKTFICHFQIKWLDLQILYRNKKFTNGQVIN